MSFGIYAENGAELDYTNSAWHFVVAAIWLVGREILPEKLWNDLCFNGPYGGGEIGVDTAVVIADKLDTITDEQLCSIPTYCVRTYNADTDPWPVTAEELPWFRGHVRKWAAFLRTSGGISVA